GGGAGDGELGAVDFLPAEQVADGLDRLLLIVEVGFEMQLHHRLRMSLMPAWFRIAAMLVLATSSAKAESLKTTRVSPAGARACHHATMPWARPSTVSRVMPSDRQTISAPAPTECTDLPAMSFVSTATQRSRPSFSR